MIKHTVVDRQTVRESKQNEQNKKKQGSDVRSAYRKRAKEKIKNEYIALDRFVYRINFQKIQKFNLLSNVFILHILATCFVLLIFCFCLKHTHTHTHSQFLIFH